jgi:hypothetical protein
MARRGGLLEATRMGGSGSRALGLMGGELCVREVVVAELQASLEANCISSKWWQGAGLVGGDSHGREWWQSLGPHGR